MTILTNFKVYAPEDPESKTLQEQINVLFLKSAEGVDWYQAQKMFDPDKLKVMFIRKTGEIIAVTKDVSTLWPLDACVADTDYSLDSLVLDFEGKAFDLPTNSIVDRKYSKAELRAEADRKIKTLQQEAAKIIAPLLAAKELDMILDDEAKYLVELQKYTIYLSRVTSQEGFPTQIEWPTLPTK